MELYWDFWMDIWAGMLEWFADYILCWLQQILPVCPPVDEA